MTDGAQLRLEQDGEGWQLAGSDAGRFEVVNDYLSYLADRQEIRFGPPNRSKQPLRAV